MLTIECNIAGKCKQSRISHSSFTKLRERLLKRGDRVIYLGLLRERKIYADEPVFRIDYQNGPSEYIIASATDDNK